MGQGKHRLLEGEKKNLSKTTEMMSRGLRCLSEDVLSV